MYVCFLLDVLKQWFFNIAVHNFCKQASKLTLAVAWDSLGSCLRWLMLYFVCCRSLFEVQFELRPNSCRESCSGVNWSVSAWTQNCSQWLFNQCVRVCVCVCVCLYIKSPATECKKKRVNIELNKKLWMKPKTENNETFGWKTNTETKSVFFVCFFCSFSFILPTFSLLHKLNKCALVMLFKKK